MSRNDGYWIPKKEELKNLGLSDQEAHGFTSLCKEYIAEHQTIKESLSSNEEQIRFQPPSPKFVSILEESTIPIDEKLTEYLNKIVIIKLNGGIGTTMGLDIPRCALPINPDRTFLDVIVRQVQHLNDQYKVNIPIVLMNSVHNNDAVLKLVSSFKNSNVNIYNFVQSCYPRLSEVTWSVVAKKPVNSEGLENYYPPGSGDVFESFYKSGLLEKFIAEGKEYIFISNVENLGATVSFKHPVLPQIIKDSLDFIVEVTERKSNDYRGGILAHDRTTDKPCILQLSQIPKNKRFHFSPKVYNYWNTNNIWVKMKSLLELLKGPGLNLPVSKNIKNGFIQFETYAGSAISDFKKAIALVVPRTRYREVKTTSNLFCLQSNLFTLAPTTSYLEPNATRATQGFEELPIVRFDTEHFGSIHEYRRRIPQLPNILELEHLNVAGDVTFGMRIKLMGTVIIVAEDGKSIHIPDGSVLENCVVTGELQVLDH